MMLLGTLTRPKGEIPESFLEKGRNRELERSIFRFQGDVTIVSYKAKPNKVVVVLSSNHHTSSIPGPEQQKKPQMILDYNATKGVSPGLMSD